MFHPCPPLPPSFHPCSTLSTHFLKPKKWVEEVERVETRWIWPKNHCFHSIPLLPPVFFHPYHPFSDAFHLLPPKKCTLLPPVFHSFHPFPPSFFHFTSPNFPPIFHRVERVEGGWNGTCGKLGGMSGGTSGGMRVECEWKPVLACLGPFPPKLPPVFHLWSTHSTYFLKPSTLSTRFWGKKWVEGVEAGGIRSFWVVRVAV